MKTKHKLALLAVPALALALAGCGSNQADSSHNASSSNNQAQTSAVSQQASSKHHFWQKQSSASTSNVNNANDQQQAQQLAQLNYQSGANPIVQVNGGKSTLNMNSWQKNEVQYSKLDHLNRTSYPAIAYLEQRNVANDSLRTRQTVKPTGWHQKFDSQHQAILNRGHIIAYSLSKGITDSGNYDPSQQSGDQNNMRNLFTQTAFCNQELQTIYETKVRDALKQGAKVVYRVQPIFQGNDLMAKGVWMQAVGSNGLNFNVYLYNVQPNYQFNYATGTSTVDNQMQVPTPPNAPHFNNNGGNGAQDSQAHHSYHHTYNGYYHPWKHHRKHEWSDEQNNNQNDNQNEQASNDNQNGQAQNINYQQGEHHYHHHRRNENDNQQDQQQNY